MSSTDTMWRVEYRTKRANKWKKAGLFETRERAREEARYYRDGYGPAEEGSDHFSGYGFGNTRVVKFVKGKK